MSMFMKKDSRKVPVANDVQPMGEFAYALTTNRVAIAVLCDAQSNMERVLIGPWSEILRAINTDFCLGNYDLVADEIRVLGTLLLEIIDSGFSAEQAHQLEQYALSEPYIAENYKNLAKNTICSMKESKNLALQFVAYRIEQERADVSKGKVADLDTVEPITLPFKYSWGHDVNMIASLCACDSAMKQKTSDKHIRSILGRDYFDIPGYIVYGNGMPLTEWNVSDYSLNPLIVHELLAIGEKGIIFRRCANCQKHYLTTINHKGFCSEECRKQAARATRESYNERASKDDREKKYKSAYMYCYNPIKKMKAKGSLSVAQIDQLEAFVKGFLKKAQVLKKEAKNDQDKYKEFTDFLIVGEKEFDALLENLKNSKT